MNEQGSLGGRVPSARCLRRQCSGERVLRGVACQRHRLWSGCHLPLLPLSSGNDVALPSLAAGTRPL